MHRHTVSIAAGAAIAIAGLAMPGLVNAAEGDNSPVITAVTPATGTLGSGPLLVTISGTGFRADSVVLWDGDPRPTTLASASTLTVTIAAEDLTVVGQHLVSVANPPPHQGTSDAVAFQVRYPVPVPTFTWSSMQYLAAGSTYHLVWSETNQAWVTGRTVHQQVAPLDVNGGCTTGWVDSWTLARSSGMSISGFGANRCYRWIVTLTNADGVAANATSRPLRVLSTWTGTFNLFRTGVFSPQQTSTWCTAASVQMMVNIVRSRADHSKAGQQAIYTYEQAHDRYPAGIVGSDPQGEAAALQAYGAGHYDVVKAPTFAAAVNAAVKRMRLTGRPVGLYVAGGNHAWVLNGFSATRDPAFTSSYSVTYVYVMGPMYPNQVNRYGYYDPAPNHRYSLSQFAHVLTPYHDTIGKPYSIWEGAYVTLNP